VPTNWWLSELNTFSAVRMPRSNYILVSNNTLSLSNISPNGTDNFGNYLQTCAWNGTSIMGNTFGGRFFLDYVASFNGSIGTPNMPGNGGNMNRAAGNWPTIWMTASEFLSGSITGSQHIVDISVMEVFPVASGGGTICGGKCAALIALQDEFSPPNFSINKELFDISASILSTFPSFEVYPATSL
jgi:hypothetical protein